MAGCDGTCRGTELRLLPPSLPSLPSCPADDQVVGVPRSVGRRHCLLLAVGANCQPRRISTVLSAQPAATVRNYAEFTLSRSAGGSWLAISLHQRRHWALHHLAFLKQSSCLPSDWSLSSWTADISVLSRNFWLIQLSTLSSDSSSEAEFSRAKLPMAPRDIRSCA